MLQYQIVVIGKHFLSDLEKVHFDDVLEQVGVIIQAEELFEITPEVVVQDIDVFHFHQRLEDLLREMIPEFQLYLDLDVVELIQDCYELFFPHRKSFQTLMRFVHKRESL